MHPSHAAALFALVQRNGPRNTRIEIQLERGRPLIGDPAPASISGSCYPRACKACRMDRSTGE
nr:hypothetical protein [Bradyrhizobium sp. 190]